MGYKYFKNRLKPGQPVSTKGFADGLAAIDNALGNMRCEGGSVVHSVQGVPTIIPPTFDFPEQMVEYLISLSELLYPDYVLGKKTVDGETTYGWVPTVSHASQHEAMEEE